jgi:phosphate transport system permease protein
VNSLFSRLVLGICAVLACVALGLVLGYVIIQGWKACHLNLITELPRPPGEPGGGIKNAIVGTLELVGIAAAMGVPIGLLGGIYLSEFGSARTAAAIRFSADVLNGIPSVVIGMFAYAAFVLPVKHFSAAAGGAALGIMMVPIVIRTTEEVLRLVPTSLREASLGLGASKTRTILSVVLPAARGGVITGVLLSTARIMGETAPLLFTAFGSDDMTTKLSQPISSITMKIYQYAISPYQDWIDTAWAGALLLVILIFLISLATRWATRGQLAVR